MSRLTTLFSTLSVAACVAASGLAEAGLPACGCAPPAVQVSPLKVSPLAADDASHAESGRSCCMAVPSCCGVAAVDGGPARPGSLYGLTGLYGCGYACGGHGALDPRRFESGFENLPNMDGHGVHHRLPFHSYRRPWAHPGIADNNISIVW